jgi:hypothetical protein
VRYLESPYDGYRVMAKVDAGGALTARLVRVADDCVAEDGEHASGRGAGNSETIDREASDRDTNDSAAGAKWCADVDRFLDKMRQAGLPMDVVLRKDPGEAEIMTVTDTADTAARAKRHTRKKRRRSSGMKGEAGAREAGGEDR